MIPAPFLTSALVLQIVFLRVPAKHRVQCIDAKISTHKAQADNMLRRAINTHDKALSINLDDKIYGAIAEIGAAQEVARWFFRVGAAAGSVAKTISAYDMQVSDEVYGEASRYVSRDRLESMLQKEYDLMVQRLSKKRGHDTRFFAFCNTVAARNFAGTNECQGWIGLRFQAEPGGEANTIILHINMLDDSANAQHEAVGILGVNLIYSAFIGTGTPEENLANLTDNLTKGRLEADLVNVTGPAFEGIDSIETGIAILSSGLAEAVLFGRDGAQQPPTEVLRKRPAIIKRTSMRYSSAVDTVGFEAAGRRLAENLDESAKNPINVTEFSINSVHAGSPDETEKYLDHVRELVDQHEWTMVTRLRQSYKLSRYLRRYSQQPLRFLMGISTFAMLLSDKFYVDSDDDLLQATGKLFSSEVIAYVQSMSLVDVRQHLESVNLDPNWVATTDDSNRVSIKNLSLRGPLMRLLQYVTESGFVEDLPDH